MPDGTVKLGDKEWWFDKEQIRNNFRVTKEYLIFKFDCTASSLTTCNIWSTSFY